MTIDPFAIATQGVASGNTTQIATLGFYNPITITIVDPTGAGSPHHGHRAFDTLRRQEGKSILVRYKGKIVEYNPERDKDKKIVHMAIRLPNSGTITKMFLVDRDKISALLKVEILTNQIYNTLVEVRDLRIRDSKKMAVNGTLR